MEEKKKNKRENTTNLLVYNGYGVPSLGVHFRVFDDKKSVKNIGWFLRYKSNGLVYDSPNYNYAKKLVATGAPFAFKSLRSFLGYVKERGATKFELECATAIFEKWVAWEKSVATKRKWK